MFSQVFSVRCIGITLAFTSLTVESSRHLRFIRSAFEHVRSLQPLFHILTNVQQDTEEMESCTSAQSTVPKFNQV